MITIRFTEEQAAQYRHMLETAKEALEFADCADSDDDELRNKAVEACQSLHDVILDATIDQTKTKPVERVDVVVCIEGGRACEAYSSAPVFLEILDLDECTREYMELSAARRNEVKNDPHYSKSLCDVKWRVDDDVYYD